MSRVVTVTIVMIVACWHAGVRAQDQPLALGLAFQQGADIWSNADAREQIIPLVQYRKGNFFIGDGGIGYNLVKDDSKEFSIFTSGRFEGFDAEDADGVLADFDDRDIALEAGIRLSLGGKWGQLVGTVATDVSDTHEGSGATIQYRKPFSKGSVLLIPFLGLNWRDEDLSNYYYGVRSADITDNAGCAVGSPPAACTLYDAQSNTSLIYGVTAEYRVDKRWGILLILQGETLDEEIEDSPIVDEDGNLSLIAGFIYAFGQ